MANERWETAAAAALSAWVVGCIWSLVPLQLPDSQRRIGYAERKYGGANGHLCHAFATLFVLTFVRVLSHSHGLCSFFF